MLAPSTYGLPFDSYRTGQRLAIRTGIHAKKRHVIIQAPTGTGKSLIAMMIGKLRPAARTVILTATNALLTQYAESGKHLALVKGAGNYECLAARDELAKYFRMIKRNQYITCDDGPCRSNIACSLKNDGCTYYDDVRSAIASRWPLTNYAYWLARRHYADGLGAADRLVCDEAHKLPEQLMAAHRIDVSMHDVARSMFSSARSAGWPTTIAGWKEWATIRLDHLKDEASDDDSRVRRQRAEERYKSLCRMDEDTWAFDTDRARGMITFEPVVPRLLFPYLADDGTALVYLSATISSTMLQLLGVDASDVDTYIVDAKFPIDRRPVYVVDCARVDHKMSSVDVAYWLDRIDTFIGHRLDRKGVMHTVSKDRAEWLLAHSKHSGIMLAGWGRDLTATVEQFKRASAPALLVSPSVEEGFDFPYDECEYVILPKVPFPDTRSAIMRARIEATDRYRDHLTMQRLIQSAGRGMRAKDDSCEVAIFDNHARWFLWKHSDLAPQWFLDAVQYVSRLPRPLPKLT